MFIKTAVRQTINTRYLKAYEVREFFEAHALFGILEGDKPRDGYLLCIGTKAECEAAKLALDEMVGATAVGVELVTRRREGAKGI